MSSQITPNSVNETFPVAGRDNNSQGFRDNFTAIKNNFTYTKREIDDLMNKAVVKSQLTYGPPIDNNFGGQVITGATFKKESYAIADNSEASTVTIDYTTASQHQVHIGVDTATANTTLSFTGLPAANKYAEIRLFVEVGGTATGPWTLTFNSSLNIRGTGVAGFDATAKTVTFNTASTPASPYYIFVVSTSDGGTEFYLREETRSGTQQLNTGSEDLAASAAASLKLTGSYFSTAAAETATLAAGVDGQIKTFAMKADVGDMVITVTNAGWKSSGTGTITFNDIGDGCTLQYMGEKWFCIGNNGAVFA